MDIRERQIRSFADQIEAAIPHHPEILTMTSAFDLFKVNSLHCRDAVDTLSQAMAALSLARQRYIKKVKQ